MDENNLQPKNIDPGLKTLRTYSSDMADAIRENEGTVIKIALAEQKRHEREDLYRKAEGTNARKVLLVAGGILLIGIALGAWYFVAQKNEKKNAPVETQALIETFIAYNSHTFADTTRAMTKTDLADVIRTGTVTTEPPGSIKAIFLSTSATGMPQLLPLKDLISTLELSAPGSLTRSLTDRYMIGTYAAVTAENSKPHLFFIFETTDYNQAYAGLLEWEKTMLNDFFAVYGINVAGDRNALFEKPFKDIIIENKDARILYDDQGKDILYYMFMDKNTFVIADSSEALKEIYSRIILKKTKPL
ncbi:MAG: hypothetical protein V4665_04490 [Patescibacteria group bacterium]